ncbi:MAG: hypothetical protein ACI88A_001728 [Paraglaciecola sp.]|jgi:hypothetical protein
MKWLKSLVSMKKKFAQAKCALNENIDVCGTASTLQNSYNADDW